MSGYLLQLASGPDTTPDQFGLQPSMRSRSPIAEHDQRLLTPGFQRLISPAEETPNTRLPFETAEQSYVGNNSIRYSNSPGTLPPHLKPSNGDTSDLGDWNTPAVTTPVSMAHTPQSELKSQRSRNTPNSVLRTDSPRLFDDVSSSSEAVNELQNRKHTASAELQTPTARKWPHGVIAGGLRRESAPPAGKVDNVPPVNHANSISPIDGAMDELMPIVKASVPVVALSQVSLAPKPMVQATQPDAGPVKTSTDSDSPSMHLSTDAGRHDRLTADSVSVIGPLGGSIRPGLRIGLRHS